MRVSRVESPKGPLINNEMIIWRDQNKSSEYFHGSSSLQYLTNFYPTVRLEVKCLSSKFNMNSLWAWLTNLFLTLFLENLFGLNNFLQQFLQNHPNTYIPR